MKKLKFRLDASPNIGLGHLIRCLSLAQMVKELFSCEFFITKTSIDVESMLGGFRCTIIASEKDFLSTIIANDVIVLDGYFFSGTYKKNIKSLGNFLICLDDLYQDQYSADMVINHAPAVEESKYPSHAVKLLGPKYTLLRPNFLKEFDSIFACPPQKVFMCFGGSDANNLTQQLVGHLQALNLILDITVVLGSGYLFQKELATQIGQSTCEKIKLKHNLSENQMINEMQESDVLIVPSSSILFEAITLHKPIISGFYTTNQRLIYEGFKKANVFYDAVDFSKNNFLSAWGKISTENSEEMVNNQRMEIDKKSPERIQKAFEKI